MQFVNNPFILSVLGLIGILFAFLNYSLVIRKSEGSSKMREIADTIHLGAMVFLRKEYQVIAIFMVIVFIVLTKFLSILSPYFKSLVISSAI